MWSLRWRPWGRPIDVRASTERGWRGQRLAFGEPGSCRYSVLESENIARCQCSSSNTRQHGCRTKIWTRVARLAQGAVSVWATLQLLDRDRAADNFLTGPWQQSTLVHLVGVRLLRVCGLVGGSLYVLCRYVVELSSGHSRKGVKMQWQTLLP